MTIITHANLLDIDNLKDVFAQLGPDGDWIFPDWLIVWERRLEDEDRARRVPWPFAYEVVQRQVPRDELIERQYAHLPPKVKW